MTKKEWLIASVATFITICAWVIFDIIHTRSRVEIPKDLQGVLEPINPNFDTKILEQL